MGFTWSVYFAQRVNGGIANDSLPDSCELHDRSANISLGSVHRLLHYVYIDNIGIIGVDRDEVQRSLTKVVENLDASGLPCHEIQSSGGVCEKLGVEFKSALKCFRPTNKRYWRLRRTISWFLKRRRVTGRMLEILLGHCTYFGLLERSVLAFFCCAYKFVKSNYLVSVPLWSSVRHELKAFYGCMPLVVAYWDRSWSSTVGAYDSCPERRGACMTTWYVAEVKRAGACLERQRFKKTSSDVAPRDRALQGQPDFPFKICPQPLDLSKNTLKQTDWSTLDDFPEISFTSLASKPWEVVMNQRWAYEMAVHVGEARSGALLALKLGSQRHFTHKRAVVLGDNLGVTLAFSRNRAHVFRYWFRFDGLLPYVYLVAYNLCGVGFPASLMFQTSLLEILLVHWVPFYIRTVQANTRRLLTMPSQTS